MLRQCVSTTHASQHRHYLTQLCGMPGGRSTVGWRIFAPCRGRLGPCCPSPLFGSRGRRSVGPVTIELSVKGLPIEPEHLCCQCLVAADGLQDPQNIAFFRPPRAARAPRDPSRRRARARCGNCGFFLASRRCQSTRCASGTTARSRQLASSRKLPGNASADRRSAASGSSERTSFWDCAAKCSR